LPNPYAIALKGVSQYYGARLTLYNASGTLTVSSGDTNTTVGVTFSEAGFHLLSYVPFNTVTGVRGNITYIYVYVRNDCQAPTVGCDLIRNGGFEINTAPANRIGQFGTHVCQWASPAVLFDS